MGYEQAIRTLISDIDLYLARLQGSGIADIRAGIARWQHGSIVDIARRSEAAISHLPSATAYLRESGEPKLAHAIEVAAPHLRWVAYDLYPREEIGPAFADGHAFVSIIGDGAPIPAEDFDLGLFLIAPHVLYRDHKHAAPELYAPLTGPHGWRFAPGKPLVWKAAHQPVWNEPWQPHATMVGDVPYLCIFGWTRDVNLPAVVIPSPDWSTLEQAHSSQQAEIG